MSPFQPRPEMEQAVNRLLAQAGDRAVRGHRERVSNGAEAQAARRLTGGLALRLERESAETCVSEFGDESSRLILDLGVCAAETVRQL